MFKSVHRGAYRFLRLKSEGHLFPFRACEHTQWFGMAPERDGLATGKGGECAPQEDRVPLVNCPL